MRQQQCHIHCLPHWRSFIPIAITIPFPEPGFYKDERPSVAAAKQALADLERVNATTAEYEAARKAGGAGLTDAAAGYFEMGEEYHLAAYDSADQAALYAPPPIESYRRVATLVYEHHASRVRALAKLQEPHFAPGVVSECYYEPEWDSASAFIPQDHLAFAHEMGYTLWLWLLLLLSLAASALAAYMAFVDPEPQCAVACPGASCQLSCACLGAFKRHATSARAKALAGGAFARPAGSTPAGNYVGLYWQYGVAHPIPAQQIAATATSDTAGVFAGQGVDDVGSFELSGDFEGALLSLRKRYIPGTGNPRENLGHTVSIELTCCDLDAALPEGGRAPGVGGAAGAIGFYGVWHVVVPGFEDLGEMCLWLPPVPVVVGYRITRTVMSGAMGVPERVEETVEEEHALVSQAPYPTAGAGYAQLSS